MHQLLAIASSQFGLFTRAQAHRCELSSRQLQLAVRRGVFERTSPHVFRVAGSERTWHQAVLSACLHGGAHCVASHRTAAVLHGFDAVRRGVVEITVPRGTRVRRANVVVHESLDLTPKDCTTIGPIPVTTPERTLIDLGAVTRWERVEEAFDGAERDELTFTDLVAARHAEVRKRGRRGVGPMAVVLDKRVATQPKWVIERLFLRLLENAGIAPPERQFRVVLTDGRVRYLDTARPDLLLAWELDGHGSHATRKQRAADNVRDGEIEDLGWRIVRFTYEEVVYHGVSVVRRVHSSIASRSCDK